MLARVKFERGIFWGLSTAVVLFALQSGATACDTPVYRYAMYRWHPAPYEVYYFHNEKLDDDATKVKAEIEKYSEADEKRANVMFLPVDLKKDKELTSIPPDVKKVWEEQEKKKVPSYFVFIPTPYMGIKLFSGKLAADEIAALVDSPVRQKAGKLLEAGSAGVYILIDGQDKKENELAEKVIRGVADDVGSGEIELYTAPPMMPGEDPDSKPPGIKIGFLRLQRDTPDEKWLVDSLLALEPDLRESKHPIVYMLFGRGRALFSCLGKGIHRDNLIQDVEFITGACSCTVKEQNPGVDLLMCYDWDTAAERLSQEYGAEEGSGYHFGGDALFPELMIPSEEEDAEGGKAKNDAQPPTETEAPKEEEAAGDEADASTGEESRGATDEAVTPPDEKQTDSAAEPNTEIAATAAEETVKESDSDEGSGERQLASRQASPAPTEAAKPAAEGSAMTGVLWVGGGLAGALILLFGITFLVLRPK